MFTDEANEMGLTQIDEGLYEYKDRYSSIWYEILRGVSRETPLPSLGIFTANSDENIENSNYVGAVSTQYKFFGNANVVDIVIESINNIDTNIDLREKVLFNSTLTQLNSEIILLNSSKSETSIGTVIPLITIDNSYNGSKAASYSFGIGIIDNEYNLIGAFSFKKKIMGMRQIHIVSSNTTLESNIGTYIDVFGGNITDIIQENFNKPVPPEDAMKALKMVEQLGKKRYSTVVSNLATLTQSSINTNENGDLDLPPINAWNMFLAIATYSATEENLNAKKMLENIAERTLLIPTKMIQALKRQ
jgi:hypothetical protein